MYITDNESNVCDLGSHYDLDLFLAGHYSMCPKRIIISSVFLANVWYNIMTSSREYQNLEDKISITPNIF